MGEGRGVKSFPVFPLFSYLGHKESLLDLWVTVLFSGLCFLTGMVVGSFLNVCIWRLPRGQSIVRPRSRCPHCGQGIAARDNIPLVSFLFLRGRCRRCKAPISRRYPSVEALTGALAVLLFLAFGPTAQTAVLFVLFCLLVVVSFADLDHMIIPDKVTLPGIILGLALNALLSPRSIGGFLLGAVVGAAALYVVAILGELLFKKESMGGGDIKLAAMVGAFVGWRGVLLSLFFAVLVGAMMGVSLMILGLKKRREHIPFGPFIALGTIVVVFWGESLVNAYLRAFF
jgi:leader peptidase (prepilin peptidase)/N-methyltransferase